ncbi:hypothetical protein F5888DRAFT_541073 [Russula emetica]|nr:hypothetical protein F5888DRAFT_541073 [Russula emetica]
MDRGFPSEQPSLPYNLTRNSSDTEEDCSDQSQADFYPGNLQRNGTEVSSIAPGSYLYPFHQYGLWDGSEYLSIQQSVPSTPNDQSQFYPQPPLPSNDLSHTHDEVLDSFFEGHLIDDNIRHLAPTQAHHAAGWGRTNFRTAQEGTVDHLDAQGAFGSDPQGSSSTIIADTSPSLGFYSQFRVQGDYTRATSSSHGQVEGAAQSHAVTQDAARQEASRRRQQRKRENDRIRKEADRAADNRAYSRVCKLLAVRLDPKNTRSERILKGVESIDQGFERVCELLEISMTPRKPLTHRILDVIGGLVEQQKHANDLRRRFEESEAKVAFLEIKLARYSTASDTGSGLPVNTLIAQGSLDTGASL